MRITARVENWPLLGEFRISRGAKRQACVIIVEIEQDGAIGRGECVPYARYGEDTQSSLKVIRSVASHAGPIDSDTLRSLLPMGAARNALDCALWDLRAKQANTPAWQIAGLPPPRAIKTCFTISLDTPENMALAAKQAARWPLLKVKLDNDHVHERLRAVHENAPHSEIVVDANESWTPSILEEILACPPAGLRLIEQPLPAGSDDALATITPSVPLCADESVHDAVCVEKLAGKYQTINIKLDKTGGLSEALSVVKQAQALGLQIMVGCMVGTSLGMAPAMLLSPFASFVDLDGPLLLMRDRQPSLRFADGLVFPPSTSLWG